MFRINRYSMDLSLKVLGYVRMGKIFCPNCKDKCDSKPDRLYGAEARGQICDVCGNPLEVEHEQVLAMGTAREEAQV